MNQLCVTGATGFLGRRFVTACLELPNVSLRLLTRDTSAFHAPESARVTLCEGNLLEQESVERFLQHDATLVNLAYLDEGRSANLQAAANLAKAAVNAGVKRVVHCSTAVVVGFAARGVITEDTVAEPTGEYQQTKYEIEEILGELLLPSTELSILRPSEIIGPGGEGLRRMIRRLANGAPAVNLLYRLVFRNRRFNYVAVENVVAALLVLALTPRPQVGDFYQISDDDDPDNNYAAVEEIVKRSLGRQDETLVDLGLPVSLLSLLYRFLPAAAPPDRIYSTSKITSLGYEKRTTLRRAILDLTAHEADAAQQVRPTTPHQ